MRASIITSLVHDPRRYVRRKRPLFNNAGGRRGQTTPITTPIYPHPISITASVRRREKALAIMGPNEIPPRHGTVCLVAGGRDGASSDIGRAAGALSQEGWNVHILYSDSDADDSDMPGFYVHRLKDLSL